MATVLSEVGKPSAEEEETFRTPCVCHCSASNREWNHVEC